MGKKRENATGSDLEDVGGVRRVVVGVGLVVVGLDDRQPVLQRGLVAAQRLRHLQPRHDRHAEPNQRPFAGELLQPDDVKVPLRIVAEHFAQLDRHLIGHKTPSRLHSLFFFVFFFAPQQFHRVIEWTARTVMLSRLGNRGRG